MQAKNKILTLLEKDGLAFTGLGNLFSFISNTYSISVEEVKKDFDKLLKEGLIFEISKGKFIAIPSRGYVKATFIGNAKGFGFCEVAGEEDNDIFIPANMCGGAIDGDKVIVKLMSKSDEGRDGQVVKVFKPVEYVTGVVEKIGKNYFIDPDNTRIPFKIKLAKSGMTFAENDKVVVKTQRNENIVSGVVVEVLGKCDDVLACELAIIRDHGLFEVFPEDVQSQVKKIPQKVLASQKQGRRDLTKTVLFTIDGLDAKDLDDAISIERTADGYKLGVHIADVGEYVKYETPLDEEAYARGTSVYFPTNVLPMLPKELSNGICSLNEGVERLALSCEMILDEEGNVRSHEIFESVIKSKARLNYTDVQKCLDGEECDEKTAGVKEELFVMLELSQKLQAKNKANGSLDFEIPEVQFIFDEEGKAVDFAKRERKASHRIIEDFMVLANRTVAKEFCDKDIPFVYRVHESPRKEKVLSVMEYLKGLGVATPRIPEQITPKFYQEVLALTNDQPFTETVNKVILRSMQKAKYMNECRGHFGLALEYYCHFTSPIRRYPDLAIHRIIKECIKKKDKLGGQRIDELVQFTCEAGEQSSLTEKNADKTEREVDDLWKAYLMKDRVGESFEAVISSVTNFGVFVELENTVEGLIRIEDLPDEGFLLLERQLKLKGQKMAFSVGDKVKVKLISSNIYTRKIDFFFEGFIEKRKLRNG